MEATNSETTRTPKQQYFARDTGHGERERLLGLQQEYDPMTTRSLRAAGLAPGKRCLEVGAGAGSIARLMGEVSGVPAVAVDLDPRFLDPDDPRYEIRTVDITADGVGLGTAVHGGLLMGRKSGARQVSPRCWARRMAPNPTPPE